MAIDAPLRLHRDIVRAEWIDYNRHMNLAYFVVAFDQATDVFFDFLGLDAGYRARGLSPYVLETHVVYLREMKEGDAMSFDTQLLDYDAKRLHFFHAMHHQPSGERAAATELLFINVDTRAGRSAPMPETVLERVRAVMQAHVRLSRPPEAGRIIGIRRRKDS